MRVSMSKLFKGTVVAVVMALSSQVWAGAVLDRIVENNTIRVGMSGDQPPMNAKAINGQTIGFEVDFANLMARALGVELEIVNVPFGELQDALRKGKIDAVMSGMSITPDRARKLGFVGPYMVSGKSLVTRQATLAAAQDPADISRKEVKVAVLANSTSQTFVEKNAPEATVVPVDTYEAAVQLLINDEVSAMVADMPACLLAVLRNPNAGLLTTTRPLKLEPIGMAVDARDEELRNLLDNYVVALERSGIVNVLRKKWFESAEWIKLLP